MEELSFYLTGQAAGLVFCHIFNLKVFFLAKSKQQSTCVKSLSDISFCIRNLCIVKSKMSNKCQSKFNIPCDADIFNWFLNCMRKEQKLTLATNILKYIGKSINLFFFRKRKS